GHELRAATAELRRRVIDLAAIRGRLRETSEALRIARESVAASHGFVRDIDGEIAERKALLSGTAAQGRLAAADAGLAML
ncbi:hypothetical protein, partial [Klebsiella pneumoniae]